MVIEDGARVAIRFSQPLVGDISGLTPEPQGYGSRVLRAAEFHVTSPNTTSSTLPRLCDGDIQTIWTGSFVSGASYFEFTFPEPKALCKFRLYLSSYYIKTANVVASNDGSEWIELAPSMTVASSATASWKELAFDNTTKYAYYRLNMLTTYSSTIYVYELEVYENVALGNDMRFTAHFKEYDMVPGGQLIDASRNAIAIRPYVAADRPIALDELTTVGLRRIGPALTLAQEG